MSLAGKQMRPGLELQVFKQLDILLGSEKNRAEEKRVTLGV